MLLAATLKFQQGEIIIVRYSVAMRFIQVIFVAYEIPDTAYLETLVNCPNIFLSTKTEMLQYLLIEK